MTDFLVNGPENTSHSFVFAHGAGAGMDHEFMQTVTRQLVEKGIRVIRFEFPYMQKRREQGTKTPPNRQPQLIEAYAQALHDAPLTGKVIIGGKSMGGRIASLLAADLPEDISIDALICLGFPFYAPKKQREPAFSRGEHLHHMQTPTLILQGERDHFGKAHELDDMPFADPVSYTFLDDGDHSFKPRVKSGFTLAQNIEKTVNLMAEFILSR
ncbi:MAG: alpha/beta fold hydrolase [Pseudomonadales bacterium]|nr:alpha/beta fold hydrolase [Pseudomonadales bacterium]